MIDIFFIDHYLKPIDDASLSEIAPLNKIRMAYYDVERQVII